MGEQIIALMQGDKGTALRFNLAGEAPIKVGQIITAQNAAYGGYNRYKVVGFDEHKQHGRVPVLAMELTQ